MHSCTKSVNFAPNLLSEDRNIVLYCIVKKFRQGVTALRIAICDDDALCREETAQLIKEYIDSSVRIIDLSVFERGSDLLEVVQRTGSFDIYILDILMPRLNGINLGTQLRALDSDSKIFFLTSSPDYAIPAFRVKASEYLLKPVKQEELFPALDEAFSGLNEKREKGMIVKTNQGTTKLAFDSILFAELKNKGIHYHLTNGKIIESTSIRTGFGEAVQEMLRDHRFFMCSTSMVVNLYHVHTVTNDTLTFQNGQSIYLSRRASRELRSIWVDFWMNKEGIK